MEISLYHGTYRDFKEPSIQYGKDFRDFGKGFYLAEDYMDALNILDGKPGNVYEYKLSLEGLKVLDFREEEGIEGYLIKNRISVLEDEYDVIIGATLPNCVNLFKELREDLRKGNISEKEVLGDKDLREDIEYKLQNSPYSNQIVIKTERALKGLIREEIHEYREYDFY